MIIIDTKATLNEVSNFLKNIIDKNYKTSPKNSKLKEIIAKSLGDKSYSASCSRIPFTINYPKFKEIDNIIKENLKLFRINSLDSDEYLSLLDQKFSKNFEDKDSFKMTKKEMISIINKFFESNNLIEPMVAFYGDGAYEKSDAIKAIEDASDEYFYEHMAHHIELGARQENNEYWEFFPVRKYEDFYHIESLSHSVIPDEISDLNIENLINIAIKVISEHC